MTKLLHGLLATLLSATCALTTAFAAPAVLEKVDHPPTLKPLSMSAAGRVVITSVDGSGTKDYTAQWPGVHFDAVFQGAKVFFRVGVAHEILHVVVDDEAPLILRDPQPGTYRVSALTNVKHSIKVLVATESQSGPNHFGGFGITADEIGLPPVTQARQIEFIGDSHTVGYGNTSLKQTCTNDEVWASTDDTQAFGALTATRLHAEYQVNAISGRGIVRNYNGFAADKMPEAYPYVLFDKAQTYNDGAWNPQVIVVALGTNDFSTALNPGERWKTRDELHADYEATYVRLLQSLRQRDPSAYIVLWATDKSNGEISAEEQRVVDRMKSMGEKRIAFILMDHLAFTGCHSHPSLADDKAISDKLVRSIEAQKDVWQGK